MHMGEFKEKCGQPCANTPEARRRNQQRGKRLQIRPRLHGCANAPTPKLGGHGPSRYTLGRYFYCTHRQQYIRSHSNLAARGVHMAAPAAARGPHRALAPRSDMYTSGAARRQHLQHIKRNHWRCRPKRRLVAAIHTGRRTCRGLVGFCPDGGGHNSPDLLAITP